jgi:hypothetical protein
MKPIKLILPDKTEILMDSQKLKAVSVYVANLISDYTMDV